ncbi:MAG TPA: dienelactone hydrolase family protein [Anaerolineae bacterium]|nr:dienelactone hydrolase family protein [Anaerolineae bacterium]
MSSSITIWFRRIILTIVILIVALIGLMIGIIVTDSLFGADTADFANMTYEDSQGNTLYGYIARPADPGPHPAVLLIHEWWGLNHGITVLADALAAEGYVVFAPDAYRGQVTARVPRALYLRLTIPEDQVHQDIDSALAYLRNQDGVNPDRVASMGFCFGGGESLKLSLRQPENLASTIIYYGSVVTDPTLLRSLAEDQPVLGIFAEDDQQIPPAEVRQFEAALNSLNIENQITIYPDVGHAFLTEDNYDQLGTAGNDAWQQTLTFLEDTLKNQGR